MTKNSDLSKRIALTVAGLIFTLIAIAHLLRLHLGVEIMAANYVVPMTASWAGFVVALVLAVWMFLVSRK